MAGYGIDINTLDQFISRPVPESAAWGSRTVIVEQTQFALERYEIHAGAGCIMISREGREATIFLEAGDCLVNDIVLAKGEVITLGSGTAVSLAAKSPSAIFIFFGVSDGLGYGEKRKTSDFRDKYWGTIETIVSKEYAAKRIFCRKGKHASLEYHCRKQEAYFVESGDLLVRLRAGRAEDRFFEMSAGSAMVIPAGLMHQRGGRTDTTIIEISTRDEDSDSYLVEDGQKTAMPGLNLNP